MNDKKITQKIDWSFFRDIPIRDVISVLGLEMDRTGKLFSCPAHNDEHPSAHIYDNNNSWHCFVCEAGGTTIDLVMDTLKCNSYDAIQFLNQYFSGGIRNIEISSNQPVYPIIPVDVLKTIGLKHNPFLTWKFQENDQTIELELSKEEAAVLILTKMKTYYKQLDILKTKVLTVYQGLQKNEKVSQIMDKNIALYKQKVMFYEFLIWEYLEKIGKTEIMQGTFEEDIAIKTMPKLENFSKTVEKDKKILSENFLRQIGFSKDPYLLSRGQCVGNSEIAKVEGWSKFDKTRLTEEEVVSLVLDKILLYEKKWIQFLNKTLSFFPEFALDPEILKEMKSVTENHLKSVRNRKIYLQNQLRELEIKKESEYGKFPWDEENDISLE